MATGKAIKIIKEAIYFHSDKDKAIVELYLKPANDLTYSEIINRMGEFTYQLPLFSLVDGKWKRT